MKLETAAPVTHKISRFSSISTFTSISTFQVKLYYHGENSKFYNEPPLIENQPQLEAVITDMESFDLEQSILLQRPDSKWKLEGIVGFAVILYPIRERLLGVKGAHLPDYINDMKSILTLAFDKVGNREYYNDNLCLLRAVAMAKLLDNRGESETNKDLLRRLNQPTMEIFARYVSIVTYTHTYLLRN